MIQLMHHEPMRIRFVEVLNEAGSTNPRKVTQYECLKLASHIIKYILTILVHEQLQAHRMLFTIMDSAQRIFFLKEGGRKVFLATLLADHGIWFEYERWSCCIVDQINFKIEDALRRQKRNIKVDPNQNKVSTKLLSGAFFKDMNKSSEAKQQTKLKEHSTLVIEEVQKFVKFFISFNVPFSQANRLLVQSCEKYEIQKANAHLLCTELIKNQRNAESMFTEQEQLVHSLKKRTSRLRRLGYSHKTLLVGLTVKYIDSDATLLAILCSSRELHEVLAPEIYKQALLRAS